MTYLNTRNDQLTIGTTNVNVSKAPHGNKRKSIMLTNTSAGAQVITIGKGDIGATAGRGLILAVGQSYIESTSEGFQCYQGPIQGISDVAGALLSIQEEFIQ